MAQNRNHGRRRTTRPGRTQGKHQAAAPPAARPGRAADRLPIKNKSPVWKTHIGTRVENPHCQSRFPGWFFPPTVPVGFSTLPLYLGCRAQTDRAGTFPVPKKSGSGVLKRKAGAANTTGIWRRRIFGPRRPRLDHPHARPTPTLSHARRTWCPPIGVDIVGDYARCAAWPLILPAFSRARGIPRAGLSIQEC